MSFCKPGIFGGVHSLDCKREELETRIAELEAQSQELMGKIADKDLFIQSQECWKCGSTRMSSESVASALQVRAEVAEKKLAEVLEHLPTPEQSIAAAQDYLNVKEQRDNALARAESAEKAYLQACRERETERVLKEQAVELLREMWQHSVVERIPDCDLDYKVEAFIASLEKK